MLSTSAIHTEQSLVSGLCMGDREVFGNLYDRYAPLLLGIVTRMIPDIKAAEGILQQSFMEIWAKRAEYKPAAEGLFHWMSRIMRGNITAFQKNNDQTEIPKSAVSVDSTGALRKAQPEQLQQTVLELIYFNASNLPEISARLNITEDMLKMMLKSALNNFKNGAAI